MIKLKGKVRLVQYPDKSWHIKYEPKWFPDLYWLCGTEEWTYFRPPSYTLGSNYQQKALLKALNSLDKTKDSGEVIMEEEV